MKETKLVEYADGTATLYTKNVQDGKVYYYAVELFDGTQGDVYDVTAEEWDAA